MGTFKNVVKILIVQIPGWGRTLHLIKDMNDQMVEFDFQVKGEFWQFAKKNETLSDMFIKGATSTQNSQLLISFTLFCNYEM